MADESYRAYPSPKVKQQIRDIYLELQRLGLGNSFEATLGSVYTNLTSDPASFGDPRFRLKLAGGIAYHRLVEGVSLHYAVYEADHVVYVYDLKFISTKDRPQ